MRETMEIYGSSLKFSLEQRAVNEFAKLCWGNCSLKSILDIEDIFTHNLEILIAHRNSVITNIPRILQSINNVYLTKIPKLLMNKLIEAVFRIEKGYNEAITWEERCDLCLPFTVLDPVIAGKYEASFFIDPSGHFDHLAWVKRFVADEDQFIHRRFEFACLYCFEEKIREMWHMMKTKRQLPCKGRLDFIDIECGASVGMWGFILENDFALYDAANRGFVKYTLSDDIYVIGLCNAICEGHEYAVQYYLSRCRKTASFSILNAIDVAGIMSYASKCNYFGVVHFLYSNLSSQEKTAAFVLNGELRPELTRTWACLLNTPFYECALTDILEFPHPIPAESCELILADLALSVKVSGHPIYKTVLKVLWNHLSFSQRNEVLKINEGKDKVLLNQIDILFNH